MEYLVVLLLKQLHVHVSLVITQAIISRNYLQGSLIYACHISAPQDIAFV